MKVLVDGDTDRVLGMHMVGHGAGEIMQACARCEKLIFRAFGEMCV